jgi:hypothetical protein
MEGVRAAIPSPIEGSVDAVPRLGAAIIANGFDYRPRFTIEEYTSYSRALIAENRAFFTGERAPQNLLFYPSSIDSRHPALAEGPLWPVFLRYYEPARMIGDLLLLRRRQQPLGEVLGQAAESKAAMGEAMSLPPGPVFLKADLRLNLFGRLLSALYKPPLLYARVGFTDGSSERFRLVPGIVREGFIVSPLIASGRDFALLAAGKAELVERQVQSIVFETEGLGSAAYDRQVAVALAPVAMPASPPGEDIAAEPGTR